MLVCAYHNKGGGDFSLVGGFIKILTSMTKIDPQKFNQKNTQKNETNQTN